jgi:hypothetical protein
MKHIMKQISYCYYILFFLTIIGCKSSQSTEYGVYNSEKNKLTFCKISTKNETTEINHFDFNGLSEFRQQNKLLLVSNFSDDYKQNHSIIKGGNILYNSKININDFQSAILNFDDYIVLNVTYDEDEINNNFIVSKDSSSSLNVEYSNNEVSVNKKVSDNLKILFKNINFINENTSEIELILLDLKNQKSKKIYKFENNNSNGAEKWLLGYYYFKNKNSCLISKYNIDSININFQIFEYSVSQDKLKMIKEFSIPNTGKSIKNLVFKFIANNDMLVTDNKNIYIVHKDNSLEKLYTSDKDSEVVYLN